MSELCGSTAMSGREGFVIVVDNYFSTVHRLARVLNWRLRIDSEAFKWSDSAARGWQWVMDAGQSGSGNLEYAYDINFNQYPRLFQGNSYGLWLGAASNDWIYVPDTLIEVHEFFVDIRSATLVGGTATFIVNGPMRDTKHVTPPDNPTNDVLLLTQMMNNGITAAPGLFEHFPNAPLLPPPLPT